MIWLAMSACRVSSICWPGCARRVRLFSKPRATRKIYLLEVKETNVFLETTKLKLYSCTWLFALLSTTLNEIILSEKRIVSEIIYLNNLCSTYDIFRHISYVSWNVYFYKFIKAKYFLELFKFDLYLWRICGLRIAEEIIYLLNMEICAMQFSRSRKVYHCTWNKIN